MGKLIFSYTDKDFIENNREANKIEFDVPDDMDINEYKVVCIRMASAMGYGNNSIKQSFGDLVYGSEDKNELKELLDELNITKNTYKKT
jgi:hypothetical protein